MKPEHALVQLLKLEALDIDGVKLYTGWTHEKTVETIEKCKASGAIERKLYKCQYGYKYAVSTVPNTQRITELQRLSTDLPKMRVGRHQGIAADEHRQSGKESETDGMVATLDRVWS